jgi:hypothetical protein
VGIESVVSWRFNPQLDTWEYALSGCARMFLEVFSECQVAFESPVVHDAKSVDIKSVDLVNYGLAGRFTFRRGLLIQVLPGPVKRRRSVDVEVQFAPD